VRALAAKGARARSRIPALTGAPAGVSPNDPVADARRTHDLSSQPGVREDPTPAAMASARLWPGPWGLATCRRAYSRSILGDQHRCVRLGFVLCRRASLRSSLCDQGRRAHALAVKGARARSQISAETGAPDAANPDDPGVDGERTHDLPADCGPQGGQSDVRGLPFLLAMAAVQVIVASAPGGNEHLACLGGSQGALPQAVRER
jgi:hypothetical protein